MISKNTVDLILELTNTDFWDSKRHAEVLDLIKVSSKVDAQSYIDNHKFSNYLQEHVFIAEEDHDERLIIRPIRIMLNYFDLYNRSNVDSSGFLETHKELIMQIIDAIETPTEEREQAYKDFTRLLHDVNAVNAVNILDDEIN